MKRIFLILTAIFTAATFVSCEDEDKDPWVIHEDSANDGVFLTVAKNTQVIDFTNPSSPFSVTIESPQGNVASYDLSVTRTSGGETSEPGQLLTVSSFPADLNILASDLATALGVSVDDFNAGDRFDFIGTATGTNGQVAGFDNLNGDAQGPGQFNAFNYNTFLSCPFNQADAIGTYDTTVNGFFGAANPTFEVIAGPTENSVTVLGLYQDGLNFDIFVDPATGIASIARTPVADDFFGYSGGNINTTAVASFFFSCTGTISATLQHTVDLGSFGSYPFEAQKQ